MGAKVHRILRVMATKKGGPEAALKNQNFGRIMISEPLPFSVCRSFLLTTTRYVPFARPSVGMRNEFPRLARLQNLESLDPTG